MAIYAAKKANYFQKSRNVVSLSPNTIQWLIIKTIVTQKYIAIVFLEPVLTSASIARVRINNGFQFGIF